jgi:hypothetical protein
MAKAMMYPGQVGMYSDQDLDRIHKEPDPFSMSWHSYARAIAAKQGGFSPSSVSIESEGKESQLLNAHVKYVSSLQNELVVRRMGRIRRGLREELDDEMEMKLAVFFEVESSVPSVRWVRNEREGMELSEIRVLGLEYCEGVESMKKFTPEYIFILVASVMFSFFIAAYFFTSLKVVALMGIVGSLGWGATAGVSTWLSLKNRDHIISR